MSRHSKEQSFSTAFDAEGKAKRRKEEFMKDCRKAFDMGARFAEQVRESHRDI
ncbi:MAG: hypothetical protein SCH66_10440 [Methanolobus sp.]|nr:hypothetical protein [Methanolobus sp.]